MLYGGKSPSSVVYPVLSPPGSRDHSKPMVRQTWLNAALYPKIQLIYINVRKRFVRRRQVDRGGGEIEVCVWSLSIMYNM